MLDFFVLWFPWFNFFFETFFLQFFSFYFLYLFLNSKNSYYVLLYFWVLVVFLGLYLAVSQMELFLGFFWAVEFTVVFICILLLFFINSEGYFFNLNFFSNFFYYFLIIFFCLFFFFTYFSNPEIFYLNWLNYTFLTDNFYDALFDFLLNDFISLFLNYYNFNSFEFFVLILILFFGSILCVVLNLLSKNFSFVSSLEVLNRVGDKFVFLNFEFLRKQNLTKQTNFVPSLRLFKKKNW